MNVMSVEDRWNNLCNNILPINPCDECRWRGICNAIVPCGM